MMQTSQTSIILIATLIASCISGTGMTVAADCNNIKPCFPVAVIYFAVDGTTSRVLFSDNFWISDVRQRVDWQDKNNNIFSPP